MFPSFPFKPALLASLVAGIASSAAYASTVRDDVDYQYFRDFAENKGKFAVGARNIVIYNKSGQAVGTMMKNTPMPDFSAVDRNGGVATLIHPQYITSVQHNSGYGSVEFGGQGSHPDAHHYTYQIVDRNDYPIGTELSEDYHIPRLHKLVTEVAPAPVSSVGSDNTAYLDKKRFTGFARAGSGRQSTRDKDNKSTSLSGAYSYLTGGAPVAVTGAPKGWIEAKGGVFDDVYGPLVTYGTPGDSGSSLFAFDNKEQRWVVAAVLNHYSGMDGNFNRYAVSRPDFIREKQEEDFDRFTNETEGNVYQWQANGGNAVVTRSDGRTARVPLANPERAADDNTKARPSLNHGKSIRYLGKSGTVQLNTDINQGAGALYFDADFTVRPQSDQTWQGAGVSVAKNKTVEWRVHNPKGDRLSKIGEGTLRVAGRGVNTGDLSVGEGTVILAQKAGADGRKQAFQSVGLVSGRGTVVLEDAAQVDTGRIYFGFRGGRLDVNGNSLQFNHIQNVDEGARIVNRNPVYGADIVLRGYEPFSESDLNWGTWGKPGGDIYEYINPYAKDRQDYFALKPKARAGGYFPTNQTSNEFWEYLGSDRNEVVRRIIDNKQQVLTNSGFNGFFGEAASGNQPRIFRESDLKWGKTNTEKADVYEIFNPAANRTDYFVRTGTANRDFPTDQTSNDSWEYLGSSRADAAKTVVSRKNSHLASQTNGQLNVRYRPVSDGMTLLLNGGMDLNGEVSVDKGSLVLSGRPTPRALNMQTGEEIVVENDWINRYFHANRFVANNQSVLNIGRNVSRVKGDFLARNQAVLNLGYDRNTTPVCERSDYTGAVKCGRPELAAQTAASLPHTHIGGNIRLEGRSVLNLGKSVLEGRIQADAATKTNLSADARWKMTDSSTVGNLSGSSGAEITLNAADKSAVNRFHTLTVNGNLSGNIRFNYLADMAQSKGDKVVVNGLASGVHRLFVQNTGREPVRAASALTLLELNHKEQAGSQVDIALANPNQAVDLGAYRYRLVKQNNTYQLGNPAVRQETGNTASQPNPNASARPSRPVRNHTRYPSYPYSRYPNHYMNRYWYNISAEEEPVENFVQADIISRYSNTALSDLSAQANNAIQFGHRIDHHLTEHSHKSIWLENSVQKSGHASAFFRPYRQTSQLTQWGFSTPLDDAGRVSVGAVVAHGRSDNVFSDEATGKSKLLNGAVYGKAVSEKGWFAGVDAYYGKARNTLYSEGEQTRFNRNLSGLGLNVGRQWQSEIINVQAAAGVRRHYLSGVDYDLNGAHINAGSARFSVYHAGVKFDRVFEAGGIKLTPSWASYYVDTFNKQTKLQVNGIALNQQWGRYFQHKLGLSAEKGAWNVAAGAGVLKGSQTAKQHHTDIKLTYKW